MEKIDLKDRKILYELDLDARQSFTQIGKKVGLKKDMVAYRVKRMQDFGIIKNFYTAINTFKLGYSVFRIYINFQYVSSQVKEKIIQHFISYKNVWTVLSLKAEIDFDVVVWVKDIYEFYQFWSKTLDEFEDYFAKYTISIYVQSYAYKKSFLLLPEVYEKTDREMYITTCSGQQANIDEIDYMLLNEIVVNARIPLIELAEKLGCTSQTVSYRLHNLRKIDVIQGFRVAVDLSKLGFQHYKLEVYLRDHKKGKLIWDFLKVTPHLEYLNVAAGWCDLEFELIVENIEKLNKIMEEIDTKFPNAIKKQAFWIFDKRHIDRWLPDLYIKN
ncbi:MAG: Lrp/AsnC family transcriptional regulator [Candidatus Thermoplasmatota archaeon]|nr:Lrp/AsnC family transcriptional regulator [Candidatus Thermoplasmatota archaeon]